MSTIELNITLPEASRQAIQVKRFDFTIGLDQDIYYDVTRGNDIAHMMQVIKDGGAFIFNGGGVYAFCAANVNGLETISAAKKRNMHEKIPVTATSWENLKGLIDWNLFTHNRQFHPDELRSFFKTMHHTLPAVVIYPVDKEKTMKFLAERLNSDWAEQMIWKTGNDISTLAVDTIAYPGVKTLVEQATHEKIPVLFLTSANFPGKPTIDNYDDARQTFPGIPILDDSLMNAIVMNHRGRGYKNENNGWASYTVINATSLLESDTLEVGTNPGRIGSLSPEVVQQFAALQLGESRLNISTRSAERQLSIHPPFADTNSNGRTISGLYTMIDLFSYIENYHTTLRNYTTGHSSNGSKR